MKKMFLFFTFSLLFLSNMIVVDAEITYDIENITVSNSTIVFKGWAYMRRVNNIGGQTLSLSLTATDGAIGSAGITRDVTNYEYQDLFPIMCVRTIPGNGGKGFCHTKAESSTRCSSSANYDSCLYDNGKFTISYDLKELYDKFKTNEIFFDLKVTVSGQSETIRIGAYDANVKNNSNKWKSTVKTSNSVYISVRSDPYFQTPYGDRYKPDTKWHENNVINIALYKKVTYNNSVNIGTYCNSANQCAYASWVTASQVFSLKLDEEEEEEPKDCPNIAADLSCNSSKDYNSDCDAGITDTIQGSEADAQLAIPSGAELCDYETSISLTADVNFKQNGKLQFFNPVLSTYSGGFFTFSAKYENTAVWKYNKDPICPSLEVTYVEENATYTEEVYDPKTNKFIQVTKKCKGDCGNPDCVDSTQYYSKECPEDGYEGSKTEKDIIKLIQAKHQLPETNLDVSLPDSSPVEDYMSDLFNSWSCTRGSVTGWLEGTELKTKCEYTLPNAWINKKTSAIKYTLDSGPDVNYIIRFQEYAVALKQPTGTVYIEMSFPELSVLPFLTKWSADYKCGVNCEQKLYDFENGGYLYYFRPISLSQPFPNREPGKNWFEWIEQGGDLERFVETYTSDNNIEYYVTLSNSDIANIKQYNDNMNYGGGRGYLNYSIDVNGNSDFIRTYNYFTLGNVNHSGLGVFDPEDDMQ